LPALAQVLARHKDVQIVVHSTWRHHYDLEELRGLLVVGVTSGPGRLEGIEQWLAEHRAVRSYGILDDDREDFAPRPAGLILCDPSRGVSDSDVRRRLLTWLEG
jgi:hypothetical protein